MIELVSHKLCISCNVCVQVCPTNVFDSIPNQPPVIARQSDCQTCFMCEAYCPVDALFVAPQSHTNLAVNEDELIESGIMGEYRRILGWGYGRSFVYDKQGKLEQAIQDYNQAVAINPQYADAYYNRGLEITIPPSEQLLMTDINDGSMTSRL